MTNGEKYKTAQERAEAFAKHDGHPQASQTGSIVLAAMNWLDLESEEEKPLPCIWCKHETYVCKDQNYGQVRCKNCMAEGPAADSKEHAIRNYNRVAKVVKESEAK